MMNNSVIGFCIAAAALAVSGCNITDNNSNDNNGGQPTISRDARVQLSLAFALDDAVALVANEDIVQEERSLDTGLFNYRVIGGPASRMGFSNRAAALRQGDQQDASTIAGSNLLALDAEGTLSPALVTNFPLKVMYTVANPSGDKIYIALDPGWFSNDSQVDADGNWIDFSRVIAESNCALFEVTIATNAYSCVSEGVFVKNMDDAYMKAISGNQKPIQFDGAGNLYFSGTEFTIEETTWDKPCVFDEAEQANVCETLTTNWINQTTWQPRIFKREVGATTATTVTQDNEHIEFFSVLKSGELVYQSRNESTGAALLKMLQSGSLIDLTDGTGWGLDFFTVDDRNTVIFGQAEGSGTGSNGLRFARPRTAGGVEKASLDTSLFGGDNGGSGWGNPKPRRLLVGDNGRIYGVFEGGRNTVDAAGDSTGWEQTLTVYQILPFDGVPKLELSLGQDDWWSWMQNTPFQVSGDMLYYSDSVDVPFQGTADVIRMVDLNTRLQTELLTPDIINGTGRYEIYNWRLAGDELHFSGLKKDNNRVVTGIIDTSLFDPGVASSVYLTVNEVASAAGAASAIQDIEVIRQVSSEVDPQTAPTLTFFQSMENLFSMSIDFSASMDMDSVESNLTLVDGALTSIDMMKVWVNKTLHLIPDLDDEGLGNATTTALTPNTVYTLEAGFGTTDKFGNALASGQSRSLTTRPDSGWYTANNTLVYAGRADANWAWSSYDFVGVTVPDDFELTFDAKNFSSDGIELMLFDLNGTEHNRTTFRMGLNSGSWLDYLDTQADSSWINIDTPDIFNGSWKTYRLEVYGNNLRVAAKPQGSSDTQYQLVSGFTLTDLASRTGTINNRLLLRVIQPIGFDNFRIKTLDSAGNVTNNAFYTQNFSGGVPAGPEDYGTDLTQATGYNDIN
jgi:hypothetical protein